MNGTYDAAASYAFEFLFKDQIVMVDEVWHRQTADGCADGSRVFDDAVLLVLKVEVACDDDHHHGECQKQAGDQKHEPGPQSRNPIAHHAHDGDTSLIYRPLHSLSPRNQVTVLSAHFIEP
ncbi:hypothetical protein [Roseibium sp.]|uniref:hypothetical protein n=1 Tax=Roseibium sp. TaxID=1936156 RepID=UPI003A9877D3